MCACLWPDAYSIISGKTVRDTDHSVVYRGDRMVHDPHPSGAGLSSIGDACLFVALDPGHNRAGPDLGPTDGVDLFANDG